MDVNEFKERLVGRLDDLLARSWLVRGDDRSLLTAVRAYLDVMPETELTRMQGFYHERRTPMSNDTPAPLGHVPVPYPAVEEGFHSLQHLARGLLGSEPVSRNDMVAHGWVAAGTGLAQAFPPDKVMQASPVTLTAEERGVLESFAAMRGPLDGVDWRAALKWLLPLILKLLACLPLVLVLVGSARAQGLRNLPKLPQLPALAAAVPAPRPDARPTVPPAPPARPRVPVEEAGKVLIYDEVPARVTKACPCSPECTCGCNEGRPCLCGSPRALSAAAHAAPAPRDFLPPPMFLFGGGGGFRGCAGGG